MALLKFHFAAPKERSVESRQEAKEFGVVGEQMATRYLEDLGYVILDRNYRRRQILQRIDSLNYLIGHYIPACIYGGPDLNDGSWEVKSDLDIWQQELEKAEDELEALDGIDEKETLYEALYGSPDLRIKPEEQRVVLPENESE